MSPVDVSAASLVVRAACCWRGAVSDDMQRDGDTVVGLVERLFDPVDPDQQTLLLRQLLPSAGDLGTRLCCRLYGRRLLRLIGRYVSVGSTLLVRHALLQPAGCERGLRASGDLAEQVMHVGWQELQREHDVERTPPAEVTVIDMDDEARCQHQRATAESQREGTPDRASGRTSDLNRTSNGNRVPSAEIRPNTARVNADIQRQRRVGRCFGEAASSRKVFMCPRIPTPNVEPRIMPSVRESSRRDDRDRSSRGLDKHSTSHGREASSSSRVGSWLNSREQHGRRRRKTSGNHSENYQTSNEGSPQHLGRLANSYRKDASVNRREMSDRDTDIRLVFSSCRNEAALTPRRRAGRGLAGGIFADDGRGPSTEVCRKSSDFRHDEPGLSLIAAGRVINSPRQDVAADCVEISPRQDVAAGRVGTSPRQDVAAGRVVTSPRQDVAAGRVVTSPRQDVAAGRVGTSPRQDVAAGRAVTSPQQDVAADCVEISPRQDVAAGRVGTSPRQDVAAGRVASSPRHCPEPDQPSSPSLMAVVSGTSRPSAVDFLPPSSEVRVQTESEDVVCVDDPDTNFDAGQSESAENSVDRDSSSSSFFYSRYFRSVRYPHEFPDKQPGQFNAIGDRYRLLRDLEHCDRPSSGRVNLLGVLACCTSSPSGRPVLVLSDPSYTPCEPGVAGPDFYRDGFLLVVVLTAEWQVPDEWRGGCVLRVRHVKLEPHRGRTTGRLFHLNQLTAFSLQPGSGWQTLVSAAGPRRSVELSEAERWRVSWLRCWWAAVNRSAEATAQESPDDQGPDAGGPQQENTRGISASGNGAISQRTSHNASEASPSRAERSQAVEKTQQTCARGSQHPSDPAHSELTERDSLRPRPNTPKRTAGVANAVVPDPSSPKRARLVRDGATADRPELPARESEPNRTAAPSCSGVRLRDVRIPLRSLDMDAVRDAGVTTTLCDSHILFSSPLTQTQTSSFDGDSAPASQHTPAALRTSPPNATVETGHARSGDNIPSSSHRNSTSSAVQCGVYSAHPPSRKHNTAHKPRKSATCDLELEEYPPGDSSSKDVTSSPASKRLKSERSSILEGILELFPAGSFGSSLAAESDTGGSRPNLRSGGPPSMPTSVVTRLWIPGVEGADSPQIAINRRDTVLTKEPQQKPNSGSKEPQQNPDSGSKEPQQNPKSRSKEPQQKPNSGSKEPQQKPNSGSEEPQQKPNSGSKELQQKPNSRSNEPQQKSDTVSKEPQQKPGTVLKEPQQKPGTVSKEPQQKSNTVSKEPQQKSGTVSKEPQQKSDTVSKEPQQKPGTIPKEPQQNPGTVSKEPQQKYNTVPKEPQQKPGTVSNEPQQESDSVSKSRSQTLSCSADDDADSLPLAVQFGLSGSADDPREFYVPTPVAMCWTATSSQSSRKSGVSCSDDAGTSPSSPERRSRRLAGRTALVPGDRTSVASPSQPPTDSGGETDEAPWRRTSPRQDSQCGRVLRSNVRVHDEVSSSPVAGPAGHSSGRQLRSRKVDTVSSYPFYNEDIGLLSDATTQSQSTETYHTPPESPNIGGGSAVVADGAVHSVALDTAERSTSTVVGFEITEDVHNTTVICSEAMCLTPTVCPSKNGTRLVVAAVAPSKRLLCRLSADLQRVISCSLQLLRASCGGCQLVAVGSSCSDLLDTASGGLQTRLLCPACRVPLALSLHVPVSLHVAAAGGTPHVSAGVLDTGRVWGPMASLSELRAVRLRLLKLLRSPPGSATCLWVEHRVGRPLLVTEVVGTHVPRPSHAPANPHKPEDSLYQALLQLFEESDEA